MHDGARPRSASVVRQYLQEDNISTLDWTACRPNLNPIECVWDQLGQSIRSRRNQPTTLDELGTALREEWERLPQDNLRRLIRSMPRLIREVIAVEVGIHGIEKLNVHE